ncbi:MAG TPA: exonuclease domain-containing protein [Rhabdochlamydiaceae bacterium]
MLGIFLDTETNGLNILKHKMIEIAFKILDMANGHLVEGFHSVIAISPSDWEKSDPASLKINGFSWQDIIEQGVEAYEIATRIIDCFSRNAIMRGKAVFICQNPSFDRAFFAQLIDPDSQEKFLWPYHWLDLASMYWVEAIRRNRLGESQLPWETGLSKDKIASAFKLPSEEKPHRAMNGVNHLIVCYKAVVGF